MNSPECNSRLITALFLHPYLFSFLVLGGFADFILPAVYANGHGAITGLANFAPVRSIAAQ